MIETYPVDTSKYILPGYSGHRSPLIADGSSDSFHETPKSISLTQASVVRRKLLGLISLWAIPSECKYESAKIIWNMSDFATSTNRATLDVAFRSVMEWGEKADDERRPDNE
jgi:hypothetical protein